MGSLVALVAVLSLLLAGAAQAQNSAMPQPWTRVLSLQNPMLNGSDVLILQWLVNRSPFVQGNLTKDGIFGAATAGAVKAFQAGNNLYSFALFGCYFGIDMLLECSFRLGLSALIDLDLSQVYHTLCLQLFFISFSAAIVAHNSDN